MKNNIRKNILRTFLPSPKLPFCQKVPIIFCVGEFLIFVFQCFNFELALLEIYLAHWTHSQDFRVAGITNKQISCYG